MGSFGTFGAFTTARLGIYAAQRGLDLTGHNISNINTVGYTRQRLDQVSLRTGGADLYQSRYNVNIGSGVLCVGVSQLRDPYLDIRYRNEQSSVGAMDSKLSGLEDLTKILDEVSKGTTKDGIVQAQFNDLIKALGSLSTMAGQEEYDTLVRSSATVLTKLLNEYASNLETNRKNQDTSFRQDIDTVNGLLQNISALNDTIQKSEIHGDSALELRDTRNLLLDQLSYYTKISVEYQSVEVGAGATIDKMIVKTAGNPQYTLVDGSYNSKVSISKVPKPNPGDPANPFLKPDGTPTNDPALAEQIDSPNYDLTFGKLTNSRGLIWGESKETIKDAGTDPTAAADLFKALADAAVAGGGTQNSSTEVTEKAIDKDGVLYTTTHKLQEVKDKDGNVVGYQIVTNQHRASVEAQPGDTVLYGALQASREMLTEAGEFSTADAVAMDPAAATKRGIPYYQKSLDALAQKLAGVLNEANTGYLYDAAGNYMDKNTGLPITYTDGGVLKNLTKDTVLDDTLKTLLKDQGVAMGGALFSNNSDGNLTDGITAANISVARAWTLGDVRIVNSFVMGTGTGLAPGSTDTSNITHLLYLMEADQSYKATDVEPGAVGGANSVFFKGGFQKMLINMSGVLANDVKTTTTLLNNYSSSAIELNTNRDSVSGVDLNDEATNMMQYQKAYSAACRLMTTLDEALDKLINNTGVVGR